MAHIPATGQPIERDTPPLASNRVQSRPTTVLSGRCCGNAVFVDLEAILVNYGFDSPTGPSSEPFSFRLHSLSKFTLSFHLCQNSSFACQLESQTLEDPTGFRLSTLPSPTCYTSNGTAAALSRIEPATSRTSFVTSRCLKRTNMKCLKRSVWNQECLLPPHGLQLTRIDRPWLVWSHSEGSAQGGRQGVM